MYLIMLRFEAKVGLEHGTPSGRQKRLRGSVQRSGSDDLFPYRAGGHINAWSKGYQSIVARIWSRIVEPIKK